MLGVLRDDESPLPLAPMQPVPARDTVEAAQRAGYPATLTVVGQTEVSPLSRTRSAGSSRRA